MQNNFLSIRIYWDSQDRDNEGWAWQAVDATGVHSSGGIDVAPNENLDGAIQQAIWELGVDLLPHDFSREPEIEGGVAFWDA